MSQNFEPPGSPPGHSKRVEIIANFVNGDQQTWDGEIAAAKLVEYHALVAQGLEGWRLIEALLGDDWGPPPRGVKFFVNGEVVASLPYDRPKRPRH